MKDRIELRNNFLDNLKNPLSKTEGTYNFEISNEEEYVPQITFNVRTIYGELEMEV